MTSRPAVKATAGRHRSRTARAPKAEPTAPISIIAACEDPQIFAPWFRDKETWAAWFCFLKCMFGLPLDAAELAIFQACTGRSAPRPGGYLECTLICGRRGGKSLILALISTYLATFFDWSPFLTAGERATVSVIAADRKQASTILRYVRGMLGVPLLTGLITRETTDTIDLANQVSIEIQTANFRTVRGKTIVAGLCDELAFWQSDDLGANPDVEILNALRPAMATVPKAMLLKASSPYSRKGALWTDFRKYYGEDASPVLVWKASTRVMNPSVPQAFIDEAYEADPASAAAEFGGEFRTDVESFISREAIEAVTSPNIFERGHIAGQRYFAFNDPSGGSSDSMTLAIAHLEHRNSEK